MAEHILKTWPEYFELVAQGRKHFELRQNDRSFHVGDVLILREWEPTTRQFSGREARARVTYIVNAGPWLTPGYVALSIEVEK